MRHHFLARISLKPTPELGQIDSEVSWGAQHSLHSAPFLQGWISLWLEPWILTRCHKLVTSRLGCWRRQSDLDFPDAPLSRSFPGCSFMLALRETLSTYWIKSKSNRIPHWLLLAYLIDSLELADSICPLFYAILHCENCSVRCEPTPAPRATIPKTSTCCCCSLKITTTASKDVADDVNNNYWTSYCFLKSQVERYKDVNFKSACLKFLPPKVTFWSSAAFLVWTLSFQGPYSIHRDLSQGLMFYPWLLSWAMPHLPVILWGSLLWTRIGQRWSTFSASIAGLCCDSPPVRDPIKGLCPYHINFLES